MAAILALDVAGYSRCQNKRASRPHRQEMLVEFVSPVEAVRCAVEVQRCMADRNADTSYERLIAFRMGINLGDVIADGGDIFGDGVNVAARLENMSEPGGLCISRSVHDQVRDKLAYQFEDAGEREFKNISRPVRVFALSASAIAILAKVGPPLSPARIWSRRATSKRVGRAVQLPAPAPFTSGQKEVERRDQHPGGPGANWI